MEEVLGRIGSLGLMMGRRSELSADAGCLMRE